jgi:hypothetical protein
VSSFNRVEEEKPMNTSKWFRAAAMGLSFGVLFLATPTKAHAVIQTTTGSNGLFIVNTDNGRVSFCLNSMTSNIPPRSASVCNLLGTLGSTPGGFTLNTVGTNLFLTANSTGVVFHCVTAISGSNGIGTCTQIAVAPNL